MNAGRVGTKKSSTSKSSTKSVIRSDVKPFKALPAGMLKNDQHDQLMEEFRRVHRKMFSAPSTTSTDESESEKEKEKVKEPERTQSNTSENKKEETKEKLMPNAAKVEVREMPTGKIGQIMTSHNYGIFRSRQHAIILVTFLLLYFNKKMKVFFLGVLIHIHTSIHSLNPAQGSNYIFHSKILITSSKTGCKFNNAYILHKF